MVKLILLYTSFGLGPTAIVLWIVGVIIAVVFAIVQTIIAIRESTSARIPDPKE